MSIVNSQGVESVRTRGAMRARALWTVAPGCAELREETLPAPGPAEVTVHTRFGLVSRGSEALVFRGAVPESEWSRMRAPFQAGEFPAPVKYGYSSVGVVAAPGDALDGQHVFCLYPHQDQYVVSRDAVRALPEDVPAARAVLAANMETAVNAIWDAPVRPGDRVAVVGAGVVGCLVAWLAAQVPGVAVQLVDPVASRAEVARALGCAHVLPGEAAGQCDLVFHASGRGDGLASALALLAFEGTLVELSWYGNARVEVPLGGAFHSRRLRIVGSQVGQVARARRTTRTHAERLQFAVSLLSAPALDALFSHEVDFADLPARMPAICDGRDAPLAVRVRYPARP